MKKNSMIKNKKRISSIILIGFIFLLVFIQLQSYIFNTPKFRKENSKITVAEIYNVEKIKTTLYTDYVYKVNGKIYKSGTGGESRNEFSDWSENELRKYAVIYNINNPKLNFLLPKKRLPDSIKLGTVLDYDVFDYDNLNSIMMTQTVQTGYDDEKYLKDYKND
jgi:hypothetical protein